VTVKSFLYKMCLLLSFTEIYNIPMKNIHLILTLSFLSLILMGCNETSKPSIAEKKVRVNPLQGQVDALNKAKNLEAEMQKSVEDRLKAIDGQSK